MRFLQSSDVHLNMIPDSDLPWGKDRANDIKNSFRKIIEKTIEISADCLFISGNLFHRPPLSRDLQELNELFRKLPRTQVIIISGSEDRVSENSALLSFHWAENVHWLLEEDAYLYFDEINAEIIGLSCPYSELSERVASIRKNHSDRSSTLHDPIRILLYNDNSRKKREPAAMDFSDLGFDYIALGGQHQPLELREQHLVASGSPEPLGPSDEGEHGVYMGDISSITHKLQRLEFFPISEIRYIPLKVMLNPDTELSELTKLLKEQIRGLGTENIFQIHLQGKYNSDIVPELSLKLRDFRISDILDETETNYDFDALYREHPTDLIGYFIRAFLRNDESPEELSTTERQALDYGIQALLSAEQEENS